MILTVIHITFPFHHIRITVYPILTEQHHKHRELGIQLTCVQVLVPSIYIYSIYSYILYIYIYIYILMHYDAWPPSVPGGHPSCFAFTFSSCALRAASRFAPWTFLS